MTVFTRRAKPLGNLILRKIGLFLVSLPIWWIEVSGLRQIADEYQSHPELDGSGIHPAFIRTWVFSRLLVIASLVLSQYPDLARS